MKLLVSFRLQVLQMSVFQMSVVILSRDSQVLLLPRLALFAVNLLTT